MQLDADLGIDSIKRVEILSALQERHPDLPALPPEQLGSFRTLRAIAEFMGRDSRPIADGTSGTRPRPDPASEDSAETFGPTQGGVGRPRRAHSGAGPENAEHGREQSRVPPALAQVLLETVAEKTGYPAEMLDLDMRLDADLGIDSIKRVEILSALQDRFPGSLPRAPNGSVPSRPCAISSPSWAKRTSQSQRPPFSPRTRVREAGASPSRGNGHASTAGGRLGEDGISRRDARARHAARRRPGD